MANRRNPSESDDFIFVKSRIIEKKRVKRKYWVTGETIPYEPKEEEQEWVSKGIREQIVSTISNIEDKDFKDKEHVYLVLGLPKKLFMRERMFPRRRVRIFDPYALTVLTRLSAEVLAYLNEEHNQLLISCPLSKLYEVLIKKRYARRYFEQVKRLGPLLFEEQVSKYLREDAEWPIAAKPLLIHLVPNISDAIRRDYLKALLEYLERLQANILDYDDAGFVLASMDGRTTTELLQTTNFVFKISGAPQGVIESVRGNVAKKSNVNIRKTQSIESKTSSINLQDSELERLPTICLMDSGVNDIPQLGKAVVLKDGFTGFFDFNDGCAGKGHGTPIACLATYGEELGDPKAQIISYKIYADNRRGVVYRGFLRAIRKHSRRARIFLSSINFEREQPEETAFLSRLIHEKNICMVFSAGNISKQTILNRIASGSPYPTYIKDFPVQHPAQATTIVAVGAISKKDSAVTIAHKNELAPFSRCGTLNDLLYQCPKPEVVQHGGNVCQDGSTSGVGLESFDKDGNRVGGFVGTSFSAPLFALRLAEIEAKYGRRIKNVETLKAIALASSYGKIHDCMGFGETRHFCNCDRFHALIFSESTIGLPDTTRPQHSLYYEARILVRIPKYIEKIEMFIVHSDNHARMSIPSLNTFLKVYAYKTGRETGHVSFDNPEELEKRSHMKVFRWAFEKKSMEGDWTFVIRPEITADMLPEHRRETIVRYGCAILVTEKITSPRVRSLSGEIRNLMAERSYG